MKYRLRCRKCDKFITIPAYGNFDQDIFVAITADPIIYQRVAACKDCWHKWNEKQVKSAKEFLGPETLGALPLKHVGLPKLNA